MKFWYWASHYNNGECTLLEGSYAPYSRISKFFISEEGFNLYKEEIKKLNQMETKELKSKPMNNYHNNSVHRIQLYKQGNTWGFDDDYLSLKFEPFVYGASEAIQTIIDYHPTLKNKERPVIIFGEELPEFDVEIHLMEDLGSNAWYKMATGQFTSMAFWLCPVLTSFFSTPPKIIKIKLLEI